MDEPDSEKGPAPIHGSEFKPSYGGRDLKTFPISELELKDFERVSNEITLPSYGASVFLSVALAITVPILLDDGELGSMFMVGVLSGLFAAYLAIRSLVAKNDMKKRIKEIRNSTNFK